VKSHNIDVVWKLEIITFPILDQALLFVKALVRVYSWKVISSLIKLFSLFVHLIVHVELIFLYFLIHQVLQKSVLVSKKISLIFF